MQSRSHVSRAAVLAGGASVLLATMGPKRASGADLIPLRVGAPPTDQRGVPRPMGASVDRGAYELQIGPAHAALLTQGGAAVGQFSFQAEANVLYLLQVSTDLRNWTTVKSIGPSGVATNVAWTGPASGPGPQFFRLRVP